MTTHHNKSLRHDTIIAVIAVVLGASGGGIAGNGAVPAAGTTATVTTTTAHISRSATSPITSVRLTVGDEFRYRSQIALTALESGW